MAEQNTISDKVVIQGLNIFNGNKNIAILNPAEDDTGIVFYVKGRSIPATLKNAYNCTRLGASCIGLSPGGSAGKEGASAQKVEHIMSALYALGIDNLVIELSDGVFPRLNDSVSSIVNVIKDIRKPCGSQKRYATVDDKADALSLRVYADKSPDSIEVKKSKGLTIRYHVYYPHSAVSSQDYEFKFSEEDYIREIMRARGPIFLPFGSRFVVDFMGFLHGARDQNCLMVGSKKDEKYKNNTYPNGVYERDEFVRHKILDVLGTLALTGIYFTDTEFSFNMSGHKFDLYALNELFRRNVFFERKLYLVKPCQSLDRPQSP